MGRVNDSSVRVYLIDEDDIVTVVNGGSFHG